MREEKGLISSLSWKLFRIVFSVYTVVTICVTLYQMLDEFQFTRNKVLNDLVELRVSFEKSLVTAVWQFNLDTITAIIMGIQKLDTVSGIRVYDNEGKIMADSNPQLKHKEGEGVEIDPSRPNIRIFEMNRQNYLSRRVYRYQFPLVFTENDQKFDMGKVSIYTLEHIIFDQVKHGFLLILVNSVIKTCALWVIFLYFSRLIVGIPLRNMASVAAKIDPQNPKLDELSSHQFIPLRKRKDEIGSLANKFSDLIFSIGGNIQKINELNRDLETKVEMRTQDLKDSYEKYLDLAHSAGMGDLSSTIMHDFGNKLSELSMVTTYLECEEYELARKKLSDFRQSFSLSLQALQEYSHSKHFSQEIDYAELIATTFEQLILIKHANETKLIFDRSLAETKIVFPKFRFVFLIKTIIENGLEANASEIAVKQSFVNREADQVKVLRLEITDDGDGIDPNHISRAFSPGFTTKENKRGMGLHEAYNFLYGLKGHITLTPREKGQGTQVTIEIPCA